MHLYLSICIYIYINFLVIELLSKQPQRPLPPARQGQRGGASGRRGGGHRS